MQAPLESGKTHDDDDPEALAEDGADSEEEGEPEEQAPLRPPDKYGLDIDGEFRGKVKGKFLGWEEVAKMAFEVILDEMRTLFKLSGSETSMTPFRPGYVRGTLLLHAVSCTPQVALR